LYSCLTINCTAASLLIVQLPHYFPPSSLQISGIIYPETLFCIPC